MFLTCTKLFVLLSKDGSTCHILRLLCFNIPIVRFYPSLNVNVIFAILDTDV